MSEVVSSGVLLGDIRTARDGMVNASEWARQTAADLPRAEVEFENGYARAFIKHKEAGATDALAKEKAKIDTEHLRGRFLELKQEHMVSKAELHAWGELFAAYRTIGFVAQQEMKFSPGEVG